MPLIDPSTPEGFFHMCLIPYRLQMMQDGVDFFPVAPDPELESYFEAPYGPFATRGIKSNSAELTVQGMLEQLGELWDTQNDSILKNIHVMLEALHENIRTSNADESEDAIQADFVYPIF